LHHLDKCDEMFGAELATIHNLHYYQDLMQGLRLSLENGTFDDFVEEFYQLRDMETPTLSMPEQ